MSKQKPRTRTTGTIPLRHELEHEVPVIIHHPEQDMTALGRVVKHLLEKPASFWSWVLGGTAALLVAIGLWSTMAGGRVAGSEAWAKFSQSKDPAELLAVAKDFPGSPAADWALLNAGATYYNRGLDDLPKNRDAAAEGLKKAQDAYDQVVKSAAKDSPQAPIAMMGKARTLEARNQLSQAIEAYQSLVKTWPDTPEAKEAKTFADALEKPEAVAFYKELYSYTEPKVTMPAAPGGGATPGIMDLAPGGSSSLGGAFSLPPGMNLKPGETVTLPAKPAAPGSSEPTIKLPDAVVKPKSESAPATSKPPVAPGDEKSKPVPAKSAEPKPSVAKPAASPTPAKPAEAKASSASAPTKP